MSPIVKTRSEKLDLSLTVNAKRLLQNAAAVEHRSVSEFVLQSASARAEEIIPDRRRFGLDPERWVQFQAALDAPPRSLPRMARLLKELSVF